MAAKPIALKPIGAASLMCALSSLTFAQQQPPPPEAPPPQQQNTAPTTAPPEITQDDPDYGEPVGLSYWLSRGPSRLLPGILAAVPQNQKLVLPDARPRSPGIFLSMPAGKFNHLELSYFQVDGSGTGYATTPLGLFGYNVPLGDFISNTFRLRQAQLTWNYLTWPVPLEDSKWRVHTLYSFNYTSDSVTVDAPFEPNVAFTPPHGTRNIFYPSFGIATEYVPSKSFFFEARAWGFGFPHRADIGDVEANAVVRLKHLEIFGGYKYFHFKTSPRNDQYFLGTVKGPIFGLRWVIR
jgi:hypothetical protein